MINKLLKIEFMKTSKLRILKTMFLLFIIELTISYGYSQITEIQNTIISVEKVIPDFKNIVIDQSFDLYIFEGTGNKLIIETEEKILKFIYAEVVDETLNISCCQKIEKPKILKIFITTKELNKITVSGKHIIKIYPRVTDNIELFLTNESSSVRLYLSDMKFNCNVKGYGSVYTEGIFNELSFSASDEVKLKLDVNTNLLKCYTTDKSYIVISGLTKSLNLFAQDYSGINSFNMFSNKSSVNVKDASEVYVNKSDELFIAGENKSNIEYKGESIVIIKALDAVKVKQIKEKKYISNK